jgi:hypothetical protein
MVEREIQNMREKEATERKIALLELENKFLKSQRLCRQAKIKSNYEKGIYNFKFFRVFVWAFL